MMSLKIKRNLPLILLLAVVLVICALAIGDQSITAYSIGTASPDEAYTVSALLLGQ